MTQEEKAKAYDEAYEKVAIRFGSNVADEIFLTESEDERIVKELLTFFRESIHGGHILTNKEYDSWIAWLEKQGKNNMGISKATKRELEDSLHKALEKETPESCNEFLEKQGEQKSYGQRQECVNCQFNYAGECKGSCAMKRGGQKPAWSEEDESILQGIWDEILANKHDAKECEWKTYDKFLDWLKSLKDRVQPQKEWSEEDDKVKQAIALGCNTMEHIANLGGSTIKPFTIDFPEAIEILKSLRPQKHWKPNDEQIIALKHASNDGSIDFADMKILATLYEQLKALHRYEQDT